MASQLQIEANRRNSQKSTGPRSAEGKAESRFNALKTGIHAKSHVIPGENVDELEELAAEYRDEFRPATANERFLVDTLVASSWQLRRLRKAEAQLWQIEIANAANNAAPGGTSPLQPVYALGHAFASSAVARMHRCLQAAERSYFRALKELKILKAAPDLASFRALPDPPLDAISAAVRRLKERPSRRRGVPIHF